VQFTPFLFEAVSVIAYRTT